MDLLYLGENIKKARIKKNLSKTKFSKLVNLSYNYCSSIERGIKTPRLETLIQIAQALEITPKELFEDKLQDYEKTKEEFISRYLETLTAEEYNLIVSTVNHLASEFKKLYNKDKNKEEYINLNYLGNNIKEARMNLNVSQTKFCKRLGLSDSYYSTIEHGIKIPKTETFIRIAGELNVSPAELLTDSFQGYGKLVRSIFENEDLENFKESEYKIIIENIKLLSNHFQGGHSKKQNPKIN